MFVRLQDGEEVIEWRDLTHFNKKDQVIYWWLDRERSPIFYPEECDEQDEDDSEPEKPLSFCYNIKQGKFELEKYNFYFPQYNAPDSPANHHHKTPEQIEFEQDVGNMKTKVSYVWKWDDISNKLLIEL